VEEIFAEQNLAVNFILLELIFADFGKNGKN